MMQQMLIGMGGSPGNPESPGSPIPYGEQLYTTPGVYTWVAPEEAAWTNISIVAVDAGANGPGAQGGAGGGLGYANNIPVRYNRTYTIYVGSGSAGGSRSSYFYDNVRDLIMGATSGTLRQGGGAGGAGGPYSNGWFIDGGGGAGGYSGPGGKGGGGSGHSGFSAGQGSPGQGGGGGGGGGALAPSGTYTKGGNGGGVGLHGQGPNGAGGNGATSHGGNGSPGPSGVFGWGHGSERHGGQYNSSPTAGGGGGVRILWGGPPSENGGTDRRFPSTNVS